jgi:hypothetical protein
MFHQNQIFSIRPKHLTQFFINIRLHLWLFRIKQIDFLYEPSVLLLLWVTDENTSRNKIDSFVKQMASTRFILREIQMHFLPSIQEK